MVTAWPLSSSTRSPTCAVACGSPKLRIDPSASTGALARSLPPWLAITCTPMKSGVEVTAPTPARMVVRMLPSAPGLLSKRNFVGSTASVFAWGAPFAHFKDPAADAVPRSQWYPPGHSAELVQEKPVGSGPLQPATAKAVAAAN